MKNLFKLDYSNGDGICVQIIDKAPQEAKTKAEFEAELNALRRASSEAVSRGLHLHCGHGLNYTNVTPVAAIAHMEELNIGHSIVSRAVLIGMKEAVAEMKAG